MQPFFSIIIPTLNEELFLPKILDDLVKQKEKNFEVVVVDAMSQDKTKNIALQYSKKLKLTFLETNKHNVSFQRNFGGNRAQGKYLIFFDADISINSIFTKYAEKIITQKKGLIFIPYTVPKEKKEYPEIKIIFPVINKLVELSQHIDKPFSLGGNMIWEKDFFKTIGGFDEKIIIAEDHDIVRKAHKWNVRVKFLSKLTILFSLRRMKREGRLSSFYKVILSHFYLLFNSEIKKKIFEYEMGGHLYNKNKFKLNKKKRTIYGDFKKIIKNAQKFFSTFLSEE